LALIITYDYCAILTKIIAELWLKWRINRKINKAIDFLKLIIIIVNVVRNLKISYFKSFWLLHKFLPLLRNTAKLFGGVFHLYKQI